MKSLYPQKGQSVTEYGLAGALIALLSIGAILLLGNNLQAVMSNMIPKRPAMLPTSAQNENLPSTAAQSAPTAGNTSITACFSGDLCLDISQIKESEAIAIQTQGANGMEVVNDYADFLSQLREKIIKSNPNLDPVLKYLITNTANAGHGIAETDITSSNADTATIAFIRSREELLVYLDRHPDILPSNLNGALETAVDRIQGLSVNYLQQKPEYRESNFYDVNSLPSSIRVSPDTVLTDPKIENFATEIRENANQACQQGGDQTQCVRAN